jgi:2-dehydropantoate 2-reductase
MKIGIVGLGAIGGLFAGWLGQRLEPGRITLSALARGSTLAALQHQRGLRVWGAEGVVTVPLRASELPSDLGVQDLLIVAVKGPALAGVAAAVAALSGPQTTVLVAMNGVPWWFFDGLGGPCDGLRLRSVDPDETLRQWMPSAQVVGGVVHASSTVPAPGSVRPVNGQGLIIGRPVGGVDPGLQALAGLLGDAGFAVTVSERIQRDIWFKLWGNMTMNPVSALTGATADRILDDPLVRAFNSAVMREAQAIGAAIGIPIAQSPEDRHAVTRKLGAFKTSMLQDAEAGRPLELDALLGAVREIGTHLGLSTPNIDALFGLTRLMAQQRGLYPPAGAGGPLRF